MAVSNNITRSCQTRLVLAAMISLLLCLNTVEAAEVDFSWVIKPSNATAFFIGQPGVNRLGRIAVASNMLTMVHGLTPGDRLIVELFDGVRYQVVIEKLTTGIGQTLSILGTLPDHDIATFVLTTAPESFLMTLEDLAQKKVYRVVGNTLSATGTVTEFDRKAMLPVVHFPPVINKP